MTARMTWCDEMRAPRALTIPALAIRLAELHHCVVPLAPGKKKPMADLLPLDPTTGRPSVGLLVRRPFTVDQVREITATRPGLNWALHLHGTGLFVLDMDDVAAFRANRIAPLWQGKEVRPKWGPNWEEDQGAGDWPNHWVFSMPRICNHCTTPACLAACPRNAIYKREQDGIVLVDQERCRGYRYCVRACPYKKVFFNAATGKSEKCILCYPRVEKGVPPACFWQCPGRIRFLGWKDDPNSAVYKLIYDWKVALPLHPEYGTGPNVFYVPPIGSFKFAPDGEVLKDRRIPIEYLGRLFGGVENVKRALDTLIAEKEKVRRGERSELCEILIGFDTADRFQLNVGGRPFRYPEEVQPVPTQFVPPSKDTAAGYKGGR